MNPNIFSLAEAFVHSDANREDAENLFVEWHPDNVASVKLFSGYGFNIVGTDEDGAVRARLQLKD